MKNPWVWIWGKQGHLQLNPNMNECTGMESQTPLEFWYSQAESLNDFPLPGSKFLTLEDVSKLQCRFSCPFYTCVGMVIEVSFIIRFHWVDFFIKISITQAISRLAMGFAKENDWASSIYSIEAAKPLPTQISSVFIIYLVGFISQDKHLLYWGSFHS